METVHNYTYTLLSLSLYLQTEKKIYYKRWQILIILKLSDTKALSHFSVLKITDFRDDRKQDAECNCNQTNATKRTK